MRVALLFFGIWLSVASASAQGMYIKEDPMIESMTQRFVEINKSTSTVSGWRIQLLASTDRRNIENAKQKFQAYYPNTFVDWVHEKPYYKVRAGAFLTKLDALRMLYIIKQDFPGAFLAQDKSIRPEEFVY